MRCSGIRALLSLAQSEDLLHSRTILHQLAPRRFCDETEMHVGTIGAWLSYTAIRHGLAISPPGVWGSVWESRHSEPGFKPLRPCKIKHLRGGNVSAAAFHAGNTGSNPVGDAKRFPWFTVSEPRDTPGGQPGGTTLKPPRLPPRRLHPLRRIYFRSHWSISAADQHPQVPRLRRTRHGKE